MTPAVNHEREKGVFATIAQHVCSSIIQDAAAEPTIQAGPRAAAAAAVVLN